MQGELLGGSGAADLSLISLFLRADLVVQLVLQAYCKELISTIRGQISLTDKFTEMVQM